MTRMWIIAFTSWAIVGLVTYKPHLLFGKSGSLANYGGKPAQKPKLRKLAKSYKVKKKHQQLMAKLGSTSKHKKTKKSVGGLYEAFATLAQHDTKTNAPTVPTGKVESLSLANVEQTPPALPIAADSYAGPITQFESTFESAPQLALTAEAQNTLAANEFSYDESGSQDYDVAVPEANDQIWSQDDLLTAFNQINISVLENGADFKSAFRQLSDDIMASATNDRMKNDMMEQIQKEYDAYLAYFEGSQISSL